MVTRVARFCLRVYWVLCPRCGRETKTNKHGLALQDSEGSSPRVRGCCLRSEQRSWENFRGRCVASKLGAVMEETVKVSEHSA